MKIAAFTISFFSLLMFRQDHQMLHMLKKAKQQSSKPVISHSEIMWDTATLKRIAPPDSSAFYPRMIQLKNGSLLAVYATSGNVTGVRSNDGGQNWTSPKLIAARRDKVNMDTPDLIQLKDGTIIICYSSRPQGALRGDPDSTKKFDVRIQTSKDNGISWQEEKILYEAGYSFKDGCWEPAMLQLPSGEIQLFFSDEGIYTKTNEQNISMLRSFDNGSTWSAKPQIVSFRKGSRDGMPVPIWLNNERKVVIAIEDRGNRNFKPYTIRSSTNGQWHKIAGGEDKERLYALVNPIKDSIYAGAPYLRQLSTGETILSYQSTEGRQKNKDNNAVMHVAIGDKEAKNFGHVSTPFPVPEGYHALWNSVSVLKGDTVVALTSTNGYSRNRSEIWMIKGIVMKK